MKVLVFLTLFLSAFSVSVHARIGETESQLITRFGQPVSRGQDLGPTVTFAFSDWLVTCDVIDGLCARISYSKIGDWSEEDFDVLLGANGRRSDWTDLLSPRVKKLMRKWKRDDGVIASWITGCLSITSPRYEKARALADKEALMAAANM
jgi:hypothetical protein